MKLIIAGIFTLVLVFIWGFFVIANIHAKKFSKFSKNIEKVTTFLIIFLVFLSISGYLVIFFTDFNTNPLNELFSNKGSSVNLDTTNLDFNHNVDY